MPNEPSGHTDIGTRRVRRGIRGVGAAFALAAGSGAVYAMAKLYTGRGGETPIRSAILEQPLLALLGIAGAVLGLFATLQPDSVYRARRWLNPLWVWRTRKAEAALLVMGLGLGVVVLEFGSRALYARAADLPLFYPAAYAVYPRLHTAMREYDPAADNVLLLGGSVLYGVGLPEYRDGVCDGCRVYNLATPAHSSRDSLTKFEYLLEQGFRFDYAVFYHGINETRANNVPPDLYSPEYDHYFFYRLVNTVFRDRNPWMRPLLESALVFRVIGLVTDLRETRMFGRKLVHIAYPREDWLQYGGNVKSRNAFEANLLAIAELAEANDIELIVLEFAYDPVLDAYSEGAPAVPSREEMIVYTEQWGLPEHVRAGMRAHNAVLAKHAERYRFVPTQGLFQPEDFVDPCHLTADGIRRLAASVAQAVDATADRRDR